MTVASNLGVRVQQIRDLAKWVVSVVPMAIAVGSLVARFLLSFDREIAAAEALQATKS